MNTNMIGFRWLSKVKYLCALDEIFLSIGRVNVIQSASSRKLADNQCVSGVHTISDNVEYIL